MQKKGMTRKKTSTRPKKPSLGFSVFAMSGLSSTLYSLGLMADSNYAAATGYDGMSHEDRWRLPLHTHLELLKCRSCSCPVILWYNLLGSIQDNFHMVKRQEVNLLFL